MMMLNMFFHFHVGDSDKIISTFLGINDNCHEI